MRFLTTVTITLCLALCAGCASHDASDPSYGSMFKQATRDRVTGDQFWGTSRQKDCVSGGVMEVCTPQGQNGSPNF